uniref:Uncharacterized protein n=1 Tax=Caenorhabditis japonica TaxID=281687 RepID=A0A8R1J1U8_CAEJA
MRFTGSILTFGLWFGVSAWIEWLRNLTKDCGYKETRPPSKKYNVHLFQCSPSIASLTLLSSVAPSSQCLLLETEASSLYHNLSSLSVCFPPLSTIDTLSSRGVRRPLPPSPLILSCSTSRRCTLFVPSPPVACTHCALSRVAVV